MALPYEIFIGLRYLRAKRRNRTISFNTIVSIAGITLGVAALIGTVGIMTGFKEDVQAKILGTTAHILVNDRMKESMVDYEEQVKKVAAVPDVVAATPFIFRQVLLTSPSGVQGIILRGIDPAREGTVTELAHNLVNSNLDDLARQNKVVIPEKEREPNGPDTAMRPGIILGKELSMRLGAFPGDTLNVVSPVGPVTGASMTPKIRQFVVVGIFQSGMYEYDSSLAYIELGEAQKFFNMGASVTGRSQSDRCVPRGGHCPRDRAPSRIRLLGQRLDADEPQSVFGAQTGKDDDVPPAGLDHHRGLLQYRQYPHHDRDGKAARDRDPQSDGRDA